MYQLRYNIKNCVVFHPDLFQHKRNIVLPCKAFRIASRDNREDKVIIIIACPAAEIIRDIGHGLGDNKALQTAVHKRIRFYYLNALRYLQLFYRTPFEQLRYYRTQTAFDICPAQLRAVAQRIKAKLCQGFGQCDFGDSAFGKTA